MTRIVRAATMSANTTTTTTTITATIGGFLSRSLATSAYAGARSVHHKRSRSPDLDDLDSLASIEHLPFVEAASRPDLAVDLHAADALSIGDSLQHNRRA